MIGCIRLRETQLRCQNFNTTYWKDRLLQIYRIAISHLPDVSFSALVEKLEKLSTSQRSPFQKGDRLSCLYFLTRVFPEKKFGNVIKKSSKLLLGYKKNILFSALGLFLLISKMRLDVGARNIGSRRFTNRNRMPIRCQLTRCQLTVKPAKQPDDLRLRLDN